MNPAKGAFEGFERKKITLSSPRFRYALPALALVALLGLAGYHKPDLLHQTTLVREARLAVVRDGLKYTKVDAENVCVVTADNRPIETYKEVMDRTHLKHTTFAPMLVFYWAEQYGYRYHRVESAANREGYYPTWNKVPVLLDAVKSCEWTIFLDSDAWVGRFDMSLDDMRLRWGVHDGVSMALPEDACSTKNGTIRGTELNTGVWLLQQTPTAIALLEELERCPVEKPGCEKWKSTAFHEQSVLFTALYHSEPDRGAFNEFILPRLVENEDYARIPWQDADLTPLLDPSRDVTWGDGLYPCAMHLKPEDAVINHGWSIKDVPHRIEEHAAMDLLRYTLRKNARKYWADWNRARVGIISKFGIMFNT